MVSRGAPLPVPLAVPLCFGLAYGLRKLPGVRRVVAPREGSGMPYDFAARARTAEELSGPQVVLQQMIDSSRLLQ